MTIDQRGASAPDPFATLALPRRFSLDLLAAEARHLELSRALHPDKHASASPAERRAALSSAIEVNEAWRTIREPIRRAEALLRLAGLGSEIGEKNEPKASPAFLMEVMESRELLDEAKRARSVAGVASALRAASAMYEQAQQALARSLDPALDADDRAAMRAVIPLLGALRYAARYLEEAQASADELAGF